MPKQYPVGKAQQYILSALGRDAQSFQDAERIFAELRIIVTPIQQGRESVPHVSLHHLQGVTSDNLYEIRKGDKPYSPELAKVAEWMGETDRKIILQPDAVPEIAIQAQKDAKEYGRSHLLPGCLATDELFDSTRHWTRIFTEERTSYTTSEQALYKKAWSRQYYQEYDDYWAGGD